ncbi:MAG: hypothetical protein QOH25_1963, partial [Acidobacteriota bacterium]|nr:hypothetical protein [Acidobacteriota bacterium]
MHNRRNKNAEVVKLAGYLVSRFL